MKIILITNAVAATLDHADFVVEAFDKTERHFVFGGAVRGDAIPMPIDQGREFLEGWEPLPAQRATPFFKELPRPRRAAILPQLRELFFQQVRGVQAFVRSEERREGRALRGRQMFAPREQYILLPFDEAPIGLIRQALVLGFPDLIERTPELPQHMKLVVQNGRVRCLGTRRVPKRFPHVHHRQPERGRLGDAQEIVEHRQARFTAIRTPKPDGLGALQVTDDDAIHMPFPDGDFIDANHVRLGRANDVQLRLHVFHFH